MNDNKTKNCMSERGRDLKNVYYTTSPENRCLVFNRVVDLYENELQRRDYRASVLVVCCMAMGIAVLLMGIRLHG